MLTVVRKGVSKLEFKYQRAYQRHSKVCRWGPGLNQEQQCGSTMKDGIPSLLLPAGISLPPPPSWRRMGSFRFQLPARQAAWTQGPWARPPCREEHRTAPRQRAWPSSPVPSGPWLAGGRGQAGRNPSPEPGLEPKRATEGISYHVHGQHNHWHTRLGGGKGTRAQG